MCVGRGLYWCIIILYGGAGVRAGYCNARCSRTLDPVCALVVTGAGAARDVRIYHNICHLYKIQCLLKKNYLVKVVRLPGRYCGINFGTENVMDNRRYIDNTIMGSRSFCNHSCPTHCTDIYDPVCAQIWDQNQVNKRSHVLINHCHADLVSCSLQQTVQVSTLDTCLGSMTQFAYAALAQAAVLKKLGLINV